MTRQAWAISAITMLFSVVAIIAVFTTPETADSTLDSTATDQRRWQVVADRLDHLENEVRRLSPGDPGVTRPFSESPPIPRSHDSSTTPGRTAAVGDMHDPQWILERFIASFYEGDQDGSEFFRLGVEAYAPVLLADIIRLLLDEGVPTAARIQLADILGSRRFADSAAVSDALCRVVDRGPDETLVQRCLSSLMIVGNARTVDDLVGMLFRLPSGTIQRHALHVIVQLSGAGTNGILLQLARRTSDLALLALMVEFLNGSDDVAALDFFRYIAGQERDARLVGARRIGGFDDAMFSTFVEQWLGFETDEEVRAALGESSVQQKTTPPWHARQATGVPDSGQSGDQPKAWACQDADGGTEWLEVGYVTALHAVEVRIHEVCVAGEVSAVEVIDVDGARHVVWSGVDPLTSPGVFSVQVPEMARPIKAVRLTLQTERRPGWCEIDAVELVGREGRSFAGSARASSNYGAGRRVKDDGLQIGLMRLQLTR